MFYSPFTTDKRCFSDRFSDQLFLAFSKVQRYIQIAVIIPDVYISAVLSDSDGKNDLFKTSVSANLYLYNI